MSKAITTTFHNHTMTKPARITATDSDGNRVSISTSNAGDNPHDEAAIALCRKMKWDGPLMKGATKDGYVYVFDSHANRVRFESDSAGERRRETPVWCDYCEINHVQDDRHKEPRKGSVMAYNADDPAVKDLPIAGEPAKQYVIEWRDTEARKWKVWDTDKTYDSRTAANERLRTVRGIYPDTRYRVAVTVSSAVDSWLAKGEK